jgi:hypothetical protein
LGVGATIDIRCHSLCHRDCLSGTYKCWHCLLGILPLVTRASVSKRGYNDNPRPRGRESLATMTSQPHTGFVRSQCVRSYDMYIYLSIVPTHKRTYNNGGSLDNMHDCANDRSIVPRSYVR